MSERSLYQSLVNEVVDFFGFVTEALTGEESRSALISDLGGDPSASTGSVPPSAERIEALKSYALTPIPDAAADLAALEDVVRLLDAVASNVEVWSVDQLGHSLLDLLGTNYVRQRAPLLFFLAELASVLEDVSTTYGAGNNNAARLWDATRAAGAFLIDPGRTLADLDAPDQPSPPGERAVDGLYRLATAFLATREGLRDTLLIEDLVIGWDGPGLDPSSAVPAPPPTRADLISGRMLSFSLLQQTDRPEGEPEVAGTAQVTLAYVPLDEKGRKIFLGFGGSLALDAPIHDRWRFSVRLRSDAAVATMIGLSERSFEVGQGSGNFEAGAGWTSVPDEATGLSFALPRPTGTRLDIGHLAFSLRIATTGAEARAELADAALVIDGQKTDSWVRRLLGGTPLRLPFSVVIGYSSERGLIVEGGIPSATPAGGPANAPLAGDGAVGGTVLSATMPLSRRLGPVTLHEVVLRIARSASAASQQDDIVTIATLVSLSAQLGPAYFRLDQLGLALVVDNGIPPPERNLRFLDARLGVALPLAITVNVDTDIVSGGGTLFRDPRTGTYFGVFAVRLWQRVTLKAIGLIATRNPDGRPASSFIVIATVEGLGWQVGPVTVDGLGVLYADDRTFDENAVRAALPTGQLKHVLFPADPVRHAPEILAPLASFFPARTGSYLVGVLVRLTFGRPPRITLDVALIFQGGRAVSNRLIVLGRVSSILPDDRVRAVQLNLDAVGVFDPSEGTASLDAVLVDSKLSGRFPLTGSAALRRVRGRAGFALAVGGFHPEFPVPEGFPALNRITVALTAGDNPKLVCQAYLAITSNTVQFGAEASLYAAACGFSISGAVGFDVLIQLFPPHFLAQFRAKVQLKRGSRNLFSVTVTAEVEGPLPLRISGRASFEILWCDFSVGFDKILVGGSGPVALPGVDVLGQLRESLAEPKSWQAEPPPAGQRMVSVRRDDRPGEVLLHPMGTLSVRQGVVPLNLTRNIDRVGGSVPTGDRRFAVTAATLGPVEQDLDPVRDLFAPGQYFDLTDDESLAAPSFEEMDAGVSFGVDGYAFPAAARVNAPFDYTDITIRPDGKPVPEEPQPLEGGLVLILAAFGAAALAPIRMEAASRFATGAPREDAPVVRRHGWAVAEVASTAEAGPVLTWAEAHWLATRTQVLVSAVVATS